MGRKTLPLQQVVNLALGTIFTLSFITALSGALVPGPLLTMTIAQTARRGFRASVFLIVGHSLLELLLVIGLWFGLGYFLRIRPVVGTITVLGGAMLLWMGWSMIRDAARFRLDPDAMAAPTSNLQRPASRLMIAGVVLSLSNPYWTIWWATVGLTFFAALSQNVLSIIAAFYFGHIAGDILWYLAVGAAVSTGRRIMNTTVYRAVVQICGVFLICLGGSFIYLLASGRLWDIRMSMNWLLTIRSL